MKQLFGSTRLGLLGAALLLTACGGGGGGGGGDTFTPPTISDTPVAITSANQNAVAQTADDSISGIVEGGGVMLGVVVEGGASSFSAFDFTTDKLLGYVKQGIVAGAGLPSGVVTTITEACVSGSIAITLNIADLESGVLATGDSASITANNCVENVFGGGTATTNGTFSMTVESGSLILDCETGCGDVSLSVNFNNLRITEMGSTFTIHGGFTLGHSDTNGTDSFSGTSLFLIESGGEAVHLTSFDITSTDIGLSATSTSVTMTVAGTEINGSITIVSTVDLLMLDTDEHSYAGTLLVTGADGAELTINYLNAFSFELTLDTDGAAGPTPPEATVPVNWADI